MPDSNKYLCARGLAERMGARRGKWKRPGSPMASAVISANLAVVGAMGWWFGRAAGPFPHDWFCTGSLTLLIARLECRYRLSFLQPCRPRPTRLPKGIAVIGRSVRAGSRSVSFFSDTSASQAFGGVRSLAVRAHHRLRIVKPGRCSACERRPRFGSPHGDYGLVVPARDAPLAV